MWAKPTKADLEKLHKNLKIQQEAEDGSTLILAHFFMGGCDWYIVDYDPETEIMYGYAILGGNLQLAEWGTVFFKEDPNNPCSKDNLMVLKQGYVEVDFDKHWTPKSFNEVEKDFTAKYGG